MKVGDIIKKLRYARGISQEELSEKIGKSSYYIYRLENGAEEIDLETARKLALVFSCDTAEILGLSEKE